MAAKLTEAMRYRLLAAKKSLSTGVVIKLSSFTKGVFRLLPMSEDAVTPCEKYTHFYSKVMNKGTTSLLTYGVECPLVTKLNEVRAAMSKEDREGMQKVCNISSEFWGGVVEAGDYGTLTLPRIRVLPIKKEAFGQIVGYMTAEESGDNITDADDGRYFIYAKEGTGFASKYSIAKFCDSGPIHEDPEMQAAILAAWEKFDVRSKFWAIDWDTYGAIYEAVAGEALDPSVREEFEASSAAAATPAAESDELDEELADIQYEAPAVKPKTQVAVPSKLPVKPKAPVKPVAAPEPPEDPVDTVSMEFEPGVTRVQYEVAGEEHTGIISKMGDVGEDGDQQFDVLDDADQNTYGLFASLVQIVPPEEEQSEPEPPPAPVKKTVPKQATLAKPAAKPAAKPVPAKPAAKPPVLNKPSHSASAAVAGKLAAMQKKK